MSSPEHLSIYLMFHLNCIRSSDSALLSCFGKCLLKSKKSYYILKEK